MSNERVVVNSEDLGEIYLVELGSKGEKTSNWSNGKFYILPRNIDEGVYFDTLLMVPNDLNANTRMAMTIRNSSGARQAEKFIMEGEEVQSLTDDRRKNFLPSGPYALEEIYTQVSKQNEILMYPLIAQKMHGTKYQQLTSAALLETPKGFKRIDEQIIFVADKIRDIFHDKLGVTIPQEMDLLGQSAAGTFVQRFWALHEDRVNSVSTNGAKDSMILPFSEINGTLVKYPIGVDVGVRGDRKTPILMTYGILEDEKYHIDREGNVHSNFDKVHLTNNETITTNEEASEWISKIGETQAERILNTFKVYSSHSGIEPYFFCFLEYDHAQTMRRSDDSWEAGPLEAAECIVAIANDANLGEEEKKRMIDQLKARHKIIDIRDIAGNPEREARFIEASENAVIIRNAAVSMEGYRVERWGPDDRQSHSDDPEIIRRRAELEELEQRYMGSFEELRIDINLEKLEKEQQNLLKIENEKRQKSHDVNVDFNTDKNNITR